MTEFRLLGPFEGPVELPGGKPKALLARLLLDEGRAVAAETLVDSLWTDPPRSAPKILQAHVSALRKALGDGAIETRGGGYALRDAASDLARFEQLGAAALDERDALRRAGLLREALALWRGEPLAEFRPAPFAAPAAARIEELRWHAILQRVDAELELGLHEQLASELRALVAEEPLREPLRARLMLALYRGSRQADALEVYREGRRLMVDGLGIEPGRELQELERSILRQDTALDSERPEARRGPVVCIGCAPLALVGPLEREIVLVELTDAGRLGESSRRLAAFRSTDVRVASFTSDDAAADAVRFATAQDAELLVVLRDLPADAPCDVALLHEPSPFRPDRPILAPFAGARDEWPALELAAWLARSHGLRLLLVGVEAAADRRDASRTLAAASLALQRFAGVAAEPVLGPIVEQDGSLVVASLARGAELLDRSRIPVLLVRGGPRPSGLAPERSLTRFSWTVAPDRGADLNPS